MLSKVGYCQLVAVRLSMMNEFSFLIQFMDLRTRYTALVTLMTQYVKFASETLKRAEEDEVGHACLCFISYNE